MNRSRHGSRLRHLEDEVVELRSRVDSLRHDVEHVRSGAFVRPEGAPVIVVQEMTKQEVRDRVLREFRERPTTDIAELHGLIGCDARILAAVLDELLRERRIEEA